nr:MAG TPA: hypothetical protein [Caudoviricetes sp.]
MYSILELRDMQKMRMVWLLSHKRLLLQQMH